MITVRLVSWSAEIDATGDEDVAKLWRAYCNDEEIEIEGRKCRLVSYQVPRVINGGPMCIATVEEIAR